MTYLLLAVAVLVWGLIGYRFFDALKESPDEGIPFKPANKSKEPLNDYAFKADTSKLVLNFRNPFSLAKAEEPAQIPVSKLIPKTTALPVATKPALNWGFIKYSGYIRNPVTKKLIAIVSINGANVMMDEGEKVGQVTLLKNMRDSIKVMYDGKTKFITSN